MRDIPPEILRGILSSYYGPRWPLLAARNWGVTRAHIYRLANGTRKISRRRLVLMRDWISGHQLILARQREEQHARIDREYLERFSSLTTARQWLDGILSQPEQPRRVRGWQVVSERDGPGSEPRDARWRGGKPRRRHDD